MSEEETGLEVMNPQLDGTELAPGGLTAAQFEVLTKESAIKAKNLTMSSRTTRADMSW